MSRWCDMSVSDYLSAEEASYGLPVQSGGHVWQEDIHGRVCTGCGRRWAEVVGGGQQHFATEVDWLWSTIVEAAGQ